MLASGVGNYHYFLLSIRNDYQAEDFLSWFNSLSQGIFLGILNRQGAQFFMFGYKASSLYGTFMKLGYGTKTSNLTSAFNVWNGDITVG